MSLTPRTCFELKSHDYMAIIIEFVNYLPTKFNGDNILASSYSSSIGTIQTITRYGQKGQWSCLMQVVDQ